MKLAVVGANGKVGRVITEGAKNLGFDVDTFDPELPESLDGYDVVINAGPFTVNEKVLNLFAVSTAKAYIDLSESPESLALGGRTAEETGKTVICGAGIAPGLIQSLAADAIIEYGAKQLTLYVGAISKVPPMNYAKHQLTFSAVGTANEYAGSAEYLDQGEIKYRDSLSDVHSVGQYEGASTKGNAGSLFRSFEGKPVSITYYTLRWPGHWSWVKHQNRANTLEFSRVLEKECGYADAEDKVVVLIYADEEVVVNQTYFPMGNYSALAWVTAYHALAVLELWEQKVFCNKFILHEEIMTSILHNTKYGRHLTI